VGVSLNSGAVVAYGADEPGTAELFPSLTAFVEWLADCAEAGAALALAAQTQITATAETPATTAARFIVRSPRGKTPTRTALMAIYRD
jgi:hypothetical protein